MKRFSPASSAGNNGSMPSDQRSSGVRSEKSVRSCVAIAIEIREITARMPWTLGSDVTTTMLVTGSESVAGNIGTFRVRAGVHNRDYAARVRATITPNARTIDIEVVIPVRERGH